MFATLLRYQQTLLDLCARLRWLGPLALRLGFGYFWLETGWAKLHNLDGAIARFVDWGLPLPMWSAPLSAGVEFLGGALLILGLLTRFTSLVMAFNHPDSALKPFGVRFSVRRGACAGATTRRGE